MVRPLLDRGADVLAKDNIALRNSVADGCPDIDLLLIAHGANMEVWIKAEKKKANHGVLGMLKQVNRHSEEKDILLSEVPLPVRADRRIRIYPQEI